MYNYYPTGKYHYAYIPIVVSNSSDIFQQKMSDLFQGFEFIRLYIGKILILTKGDWKDHVHKL